MTFTATLAAGSGTFDNGGTVQFAVDGTNFGSPQGLSGGKATIQDSALAVGTHTITATYGGDTSFAGSSGTLSGGQVVGQASTTTAIAASLNPSAYGQAVTFTATVTAGAGTFDNGGTVQFAVDGTNFGSPQGLIGGKATIQDSALAVSTHTITATYGGDAAFAGSNGTLSGGQVVKQASTTTTLSSSANPSALGQAVTFTATLAAGSGTFDNGGTVQFAVDGTSFGSPQGLSGGKATIQDSALTVGTHTITATYGGDTSFAGSSGTLSGGQVVGQASTTTSLSSSANPSALGQAVTFTATVTPGSGTFDNGGTVQFAVDGTNFGSPQGLSGGKATIQDSALTVGSHTVTATYGGDTTFAGSSGTLSGGQVVKQASTTTAIASSLNPSAYGQAVSFTASVTPGSGTFDNGGTVQFAVDGTNFGSPLSLSNGQVSIQDSALAVGTHTITATYGGDTSFAGSSGTLSGGQVVDQASTTTAVTSSLNPSTSGQAVTFTATVTPGSGTFDNGGTVQFAVDGTNFGAPVSLNGGQATIQDSALAVGMYTITATYGGDTSFAGSSGTATQSVSEALIGTAVAVTASPLPALVGQTLTFTATITASSGTFDNGGAVQFAVDGTNLGSPLSVSNGQAAIQDSTLGAGTHTITATYSGDATFGPSSGNLSTVVMAQTTTDLSAPSPNPAVFGQQVTFTATVAAVTPGSVSPGGAVMFLDGSTLLGSGNLQLTGQTSATASFTTTSSLSVGIHNIVAVYNGDSNFTSSRGDNSVDVNKDDTSTSVTVSPNPYVFGYPVTITVVVSANPPGAGVPTATVYATVDGSTSLGSQQLINGQAKFSTSFLTGGTHTVAASYVGDSNFNPSNDVIVVPQYTFSSPPAVSGISPTSGPQSGGTLVTISGSSLTAATGVFFGTVPATSFTDVSDSTITAVSPAAVTAGTVDVTVVNPLGTSPTLPADQFTYLASPTFSNLLAPTIPYGTASTTLGGTLSLVPAGETVSITLNGVTQQAPVNASGNFSSSFDTHALSVAGSPYTITYAYAGDANFNPLTDVSNALTVTKATPALSNLLGPTITYGTAATTLGGTILDGVAPPTGSVSITVNGVTQQAAIGAGGSFSSSFDSHTFAFSGSPYAITYAYAGDANSNPATDVSKTLTVTTATPA